ncbi:hypothetical protein A3C87_02275 [Candidatus Kaiserbacteria bacterium RIFCSPHIGHO2_02_FULL_49_34]|uniref:Ribonuclease n=1 Tax=Candidatus Kaiserbacteria bacterium RIFCSPHIGHO2_02_FULL_49_34 TaxID=1798491 RepID=A0A1F6DLT7_9BACT|nr:MAG: hypothetical protein A3C87_02275 [Candidatus Kaiserbacteria bacterium RIFCSPHIGHO2_02_FULL_49_34]
MNGVVGVDEAGRGPVAGPVSVGVVWVPHDFDWDVLPRIDDSKKLTERMRERAFVAAHELAEQGILQYHVALITAEHVDTHGITHAVRAGIAEGFDALCPDPAKTEVLLDGLLHAPEVFMNQQTIIGGDASERVIALASIMAKVTRDRYMVAMHDTYPHYNFAQHKGYGTKAHYEAIKERGMCKEHRRSFLKRV